MESESTTKITQQELQTNFPPEKSSAENPAVDPRRWWRKMVPPGRAIGTALATIVAMTPVEALTQESNIQVMPHTAQTETLPTQPQQARTITVRSLRAILEWSREGDKYSIPSIDTTSEPNYTLPDSLTSEIPQLRERNPIAFLDIAQYLKHVPNLSQEITKAQEREPELFLGVAKYLRDVPALNLAEEISKASKHAPNALLNNIAFFGDIPGLNLAEIIIKAAEKNPSSLFANAENIKDIAGVNIVELLSKAAERDSSALLFAAPYLKDIPGFDLVEQVSRAAEQHPYFFVHIATDLKPTLPEQIWSILVEKSFAIKPDFILKSGYKDILNGIINPQLESTRILKTIKNPKATVFLSDMVRHGMSEEQALEIINDRSRLLKEIIRIKSEPDHIGRITIEESLKFLSLEQIQQINSLHEEPDSKRFAPINNFTSAELYTLMVYGEEEIFTSTFNGIFNRLLEKMRQEKLNGQQLLEQVGHNKFRTFIKETAGFNRLNEFLAIMSKDDSSRLLANVVKDLEKASDKLAQATTVADIFSMVFNPEQLKV